MVPWFPSKALLVFALIFITGLPCNRAAKIEKRQIGVLARTGALPQGKRSVEVLARNGELPQQNNKKGQNSDFTLDLLIRELESAESLSRLRVQALSERLLEEREEELKGDKQKRSLAALAKNGDLPQKRLSEAVSRLGYLIRPPQETVQPPPDILDPDDFLADGQSSETPEYVDERAAKHFFLRPDLRSVGSARNFLLAAGKSQESGPNSYVKKNVGSLARDGGFSTLKHHMIKERRADDSYDLVDLLDDYQNNADSSRNLIKREIQGTCLNNFQRNKSQNTRMEVAYKGGKRNGVIRAQEEYYPVQGSNEPEYRSFSSQFYDDGNSVEKRFLGRIPQLGRMHQKVQSPSSRRRPHLRPNWL